MERIFWHDHNNFPCTVALRMEWENKMKIWDYFGGGDFIKRTFLYKYTNIIHFFMPIVKNLGMLFNLVTTPYLTQSDAGSRQRMGPMPWMGLGLISEVGRPRHLGSFSPLPWSLRERTSVKKGQGLESRNWEMGQRERREQSLKRIRYFSTSAMKTHSVGNINVEFLLLKNV